VHAAAAVAVAISNYIPCQSLVARMLMTVHIGCWPMGKGNRQSMRVGLVDRCKRAVRSPIAVGSARHMPGLVFGEIGDPLRCRRWVVGMDCLRYVSSPRRSQLVAKAPGWSTWELFAPV